MQSCFAVHFIHNFLHSAIAIKVVWILLYRWDRVCVVGLMRSFKVDLSIRTVYGQSALWIRICIDLHCRHSTHPQPSTIALRSLGIPRSRALPEDFSRAERSFVTRLKSRTLALVIFFFFFFAERRLLSYIQQRPHCFRSLSNSVPTYTITYKPHYI
jgi:hypothetical protein